MDVAHLNKAAIGARIRRARVAAGYPKRAPFARAIGYEAKTLQRLEDGENVPTLGFLAATAQVTGYDIAWFVTGEGRGPDEAAA